MGEREAMFMSGERPHREIQKWLKRDWSDWNKYDCFF